MTKEILLFGDALEEMDKLIKQGVKVDAILTDIPYGVTACKWDIVIPFEPMWERLKLIRKDRAAVALFGTEPFSSMLRMSNIKEYKYDWVWVTHKGKNPYLAKKQPMKRHEIISVFHRNVYFPQMAEGKPHKKAGSHNKYKADNIFSPCKSVGYAKDYDSSKRYPTSVLYFPNHNRGKNRFHVSQKPLDLMKYFVLTYTNPGDTVLDFTMGSGTTICACKELNRNSIGIENDRKTFNLAKERIKNHPAYQELKT